MLIRLWSSFVPSRAIHRAVIIIRIITTTKSLPIFKKRPFAYLGDEERKGEGGGGKLIVILRGSIVQYSTFFYDLWRDLSHAANKKALPVPIIKERSAQYTSQY